MVSIAYRSKASPITPPQKKEAPPFGRGSFNALGGKLGGALFFAVIFYANRWHINRGRFGLNGWHFNLGLGSANNDFL